MNDSTPYWHGGGPDKAEGTRIRPDHKPRTPQQALQGLMLQAMGYDSVRDPNRVYYTSDREFARAWAAYRYRDGDGALYRVRPVFPESCRPDPDCPRAGFATAELEVIAVEETDIRMPKEDMQRGVYKYSAWDDGSPQYDEGGYLLPSPQHRQFGVTASDYRAIPRWHPFPDEVALHPDGRLTWPMPPPGTEELF